MDQVLEEALDEATGASSKRWALLLLVFVAGGILALWLAKRARSVEADVTAEPDVIPAVPEPASP